MMPPKTAVLIDGAFFLRRLRLDDERTPGRAADAVTGLAAAHLRASGRSEAALYRVFFYDCPPLANPRHNPVTNVAVNFGASDVAVFRRGLHAALRTRRKVALRLGYLDENNLRWAFREQVMKDLLRRKRELDDLSEEDVAPEVRQKGVDMRIGLDIAALALKRQVDQIVLVAGDSDFVPAAKLARREGIDFLLDPMGATIRDDLNEHVDGVRSVKFSP